MLTKPVTYASWMRETKVDGIFSEKTRSALLTNIDNALLAYGNAGQDERLEALHAVWDAYETWYASKRKKDDGAVKSIRNDGNQMAEFESWLKEEESTLLPAAENGWLHGPNCYAYAMKCKRPAGNGMTPGIASGKGATTEGIERQRPEYVKRLFEGIARDAKADNNKTVRFYPPGVDDLGTPQNPRHMPNLVSKGTYLVAMLATDTGFHFMRRDTETGLWSHKNRSDGPVETSVMHVNGGRLGFKSSPITDEVAIELLNNAFPGVNYQPFGGGYVFAGYIVVPDAGLVVSGSTGRFNNA